MSRAGYIDNEALAPGTAGEWTQKFGGTVDTDKGGNPSRKEGREERKKMAVLEIISVAVTCVSFRCNTAHPWLRLRG